ncbi:hypothetical protein [Adlercreutzia muris]|uniref:hypothetical protein n=1 Tax=Adlercreutzia muris TaxID=1796610 RepID=UPI0013665698|nr:hypothetical protein [Adlercreutzia muris]NCA31428.1 hypothetical protein [Adlercreutzia muris]
MRGEVEGVIRRTVEDALSIFLEEGDDLVGSQSSSSSKSRLRWFEGWWCSLLTRGYPHVFVEGIYRKRAWAGSFEAMVVVVVVGDNDDGYRKVIEPVEGRVAELAEC